MPGGLAKRAYLAGRSIVEEPTLAASQTSSGRVASRKPRYGAHEP
jgi:hypothetical protein